MNLPNNIGEALMRKNKPDSRDFEWAIPLETFIPIFFALVFAITVLVSLL